MSKAAKAKPADKFVCPECSKEFQNLAGLRGHLAYKHKAPTKVEKSTKPAPPKAREKQKRSASVSVPTQDDRETVTVPGTAAAGVAPIGAVSNTDADEHLTTAAHAL